MPHNTRTILTFGNLKNSDVTGMVCLNIHIKFMNKTNTLVALYRDLVSINPSASDW